MHKIRRGLYIFFNFFFFMCFIYILTFLSRTRPPRVLYRAEKCVYAYTIIRIITVDCFFFIFYIHLHRFDSYVARLVAAAAAHFDEDRIIIFSKFLFRPETRNVLEDECDGGARTSLWRCTREILNVRGARRVFSVFT